VKTYDGLLGDKRHDELGRWPGLCRFLRSFFLDHNPYRSNPFGILALETNKQKIGQEGGE